MNKTGPKLKFVGQGQLPSEGFVRLTQIIGDHRRGIPGVLPISRAAWYKGVKSGIYPQPVKPSPRTSLYRVEDIREMLAKFAA